MSSNAIHAQRLERLQGYLEADPENDRLRAEVFEVALEGGNLELAEQMVNAMLSKDVGSQPWEHRRALVLLARKDFPAAQAILESLVAAGVNDIAVVCNLAFVLFAQGRVEAARDRLTDLVEGAQAVDQHALTLWLRCQHHLAQLSDGLRKFDEQIAAHSVSAEARGVASLMALDAGRLADAQAWSTQALADDPGQFEALACQGSLALGKQDAEAAMACFERALARNPEDGRCWSGLAFTHLLKQRFDEAHRAFLKAVGHMTGHIGTWIGLGWCDFMRHDLPAAHRAFAGALALDRNFAESHGSLAVVLAAEGKRAEAAWEIERALGLDKHCLSARYAQALLSGEASDPAAFRRLALHALAQHRGPVEGQSLADAVLPPPRH
ncbi:tetratricopeptide repeat protein [Ralstonia pseudosolanacearum]|uniref:tetratricopeptide repeat protein n=1 Tax=Ralstonia pseudosolanacearum TaxID=1310165 RepID=UPI003D0175EB